MQTELNFENIEDGAYILSSPNALAMNESMRYMSTEYERLYAQKVRLPDGNHNIIYLLSDSFDSALNMLNSNSFDIPPKYRRIFYPLFHIGKFMGYRFRVNNRSIRKERNKLIAQHTKLRPFPSTKITTSENVFYITSDVYAAMKPIMQKMSAFKVYKNFFQTFIESIEPYAPPKEPADKKGNNNRILIIDVDSFSFKTNSSFNENKTNPLFLLYLALLYTKDLKNFGVDMDMMICSKNTFIKFNPIRLNRKTFPVFKRALFRMMNVNIDDYTNNLSEEEKDELVETPGKKTVAAAVNKAVEPYAQLVTPETKAILTNAVEDKLQQKVATIAALDKKIKEEQQFIAPKPKEDDTDDVFKKNLNIGTSLTHTNPVKTPLDEERERLFKAIGGYQYQSIISGDEIINNDIEDDEDEGMNTAVDDDVNEDIADDATDIIINDDDVAEEVEEEIHEKIYPMKNPNTAQVNSARDLKLREEQKKLIIKNSTIEEILERDASNVPVETSDKSEVMHTSNTHMQKITFANFDKTYLDKLYDKDIISCFDSLKDKEHPFYITGIDVKDTSTSVDLKETWTVHLVDEVQKRFTITVDIPKFKDNRFMLLGGIKYIILKQNLYNPIVKDTPDTVIITTNYNKITVNRAATKSLSDVERIYTLIKKSPNQKIFITGNSSIGNSKYISTLEYDELSRHLFRFKTKNCDICFSRLELNDSPEGMKGNEFYIGKEHGNPIFINEDTGRDRLGRTIADIIYQNLSDEDKAIYDSIKPKKQLMYARCKLAGKFIPVISALLIWQGLVKSLDDIGVPWKFNENMKHIPTDDSSKRYIRFADGVLEYESQIYAELILNGLLPLHPENMQFAEFNTEAGYVEYIYSICGSYNAINEINNFKQFLIDPITKDICRDTYLPQTPEGLLIEAVKHLADNQHVSKASDKSYRIRSIETIPAILYTCIANQYKQYVARKLPMTLKRDCVIKQLLALRTVEAYSTLNPAVEMHKTHVISAKGFKGSNEEHSYKDMEKRAYDPSQLGKIAMSTNADAGVGVTKQLVVEPTITNARGYRDPIEDPETLQDVNIYSPIELMTPGTARIDDPMRTSIAVKQSQHVVPVADAVPALISNGFDEAVQFHLSDDFVINAEEDGQVVEVNDDIGFIMVQYKSGKTKAIPTKPEIVKNSASAFFISNTLTPTHTKVGEKFKKDEVLAYHPKYFKWSDMSGLRYSVGPLAKVAIMSTYNTYEDAGICTEKLAERMKTTIVYEELIKLKMNNNVLSLVKIGDHLNIGDPLIKFDAGSEDKEIGKLLSKLNDENKELLEEETKNEIHTSHAGKVIDIKVSTKRDPSLLSPSLAKIVQDYFDKGNNKKEFLQKYDSSDGIIKSGYMLTDQTEPIVNKYDSLEGYKGIDVLIKIYIEHDDIVGVGDKIAQYNANKQIISEIIPKGYEPYSELHPEEEISLLCSSGVIARRMTSGILAIGSANKVLIELKRKIKDEIKYK